jgi:hypothetical protein
MPACLKLQLKALEVQPIMRQLDMGIAALCRQFFVCLVVVPPPTPGPDQKDPLRLQLVHPRQDFPQRGVGEVIGVWRGGGGGKGGV